ncbi:MAG TPA: pyridoxal-phosphate dependent enzyme [Gemmatimonadaceae bacterium]|nr:pyridoxal-phosphate dependent enzyme [Gemmatimonadaceae bacterium]
MRLLEAPTPARIQAARDRIRGSAVRTPLVRLDVDVPFELWIKLESLQPIGSFKLRGALNAIRSLPASDLSEGVYTASAGNMAQGVAWGARELGVACTVLVPERAPQTKVDAITRLGARIIKLSYEEWWQAIVDHGRVGMKGRFIHPVSDPEVLAGNATIGAEIAEDLDGIAAVFVPYGGGGMAAGIAAALGAPSGRTKIYGCEVETAAPFRASLDARAPMTIEHTPSFVDGIGGRSVLEEMWPLTSTLLADSLVVSVTQVANAVRQLVIRGRVVAEGAGATGVAAALATHERTLKAGDRCVAVVSGGNIDAAVLADILMNRL